MNRDEQPADSAAGVALIAGSAVAYSSAGFFTRLIGVDLWTLVFWRGIFSAAFLLTVGSVVHRRAMVAALRSLDRPAWLAAGFSTAAMFCYLAALRATSVADVAIVYGTAPFVTAGLGLLVLRERPARSTLPCSALALVGLVLMFGDARLASDLRGDALAVGMTVLMASMIVAIRRSRSASSALPIAAVSSLASSVAAAVAARPAGPGAVQLAELALFGVGQLGLGLLLLTAGSRRLSASRVALVGGLDVPLAPIWVWLAFGEVPAAATVAGGVAVVAAVALNALAGGSRRQGRRPKPGEPRRPGSTA